MHPFHNFVSYDKHGSLIMDEGRGAYITDIDGNRYFDAVGGMWCTNIGLGSREMVDAIAQQVSKLAYANPFTDMSNVTVKDIDQSHDQFTDGSNSLLDAVAGGH